LARAGSLSATSRDSNASTSIDWWVLPSASKYRVNWLPLTLIQPVSPLFQPLHCVCFRAQLLPPPSESLFLIASVRRSFPTPCARVKAPQLASSLAVHEKASSHLEPFLLLSDRNPWATMNSAVPDRYSALDKTASDWS
jgi:hypothetical protein